MISITTFPLIFSSLQTIQKYTERLLIRKTDKDYRKTWILSVLGQWGGKWNLTLKKCTVLHYGRNSIGCQYNMYGQPLAEATAEKDLGAVFPNDLKVVQQCREAYCNTHQILGLVQRTIAFKNPAVLISLYKSFVRHHLKKLFRYGAGITRKIKSCWRESSTGLHACFQSWRTCHMNIGLPNWNCGHLRSVETVLIW